MWALREDYLKVDSLWTRFTTFDIDKNGATLALEGFFIDDFGPQMGRHAAKRSDFLLVGGCSRQCGCRFVAGSLDYDEFTRLIQKELMLARIQFGLSTTEIMKTQASGHHTLQKIL